MVPVAKERFELATRTTTERERGLFVDRGAAATLVIRNEHSKLQNLTSSNSTNRPVTRLHFEWPPCAHPRFVGGSLRPL